MEGAAHQLSAVAVPLVTLPMSEHFITILSATCRGADPNAGPPASDDAVTASAVNALRSRLEKATALEKECDDLRKINAFLRRQGGSLDSSGGSGGISAAVESVMKESEDVIAALKASVNTSAVIDAAPKRACALIAATLATAQVKSTNRSSICPLRVLTLGLDSR